MTARFLVIQDDIKTECHTMEDAIDRINQEGGAVYALCADSSAAINMDEAEAHELRRQMLERELNARNMAPPIIKRNLLLRPQGPRSFVGVREALWKQLWKQ
jgi:hypothetical protein